MDAVIDACAIFLLIFQKQNPRVARDPGQLAESVVAARRVTGCASSMRSARILSTSVFRSAARICRVKARHAMTVHADTSFLNFDSSMPTYFFHIRRGRYANAVAEGIELPDLEAARREAAMICRDMLCRDMARDITGECDNPQWQMEVADRSGRPVFRLSLVAESLEDG